LVLWVQVAVNFEQVASQFNSVSIAHQAHGCEATQCQCTVFESHVYLQVIKSEMVEPSDLGGSAACSGMKNTVLY
jgi:hypothetical protein